MANDTGDETTEGIIQLRDVKAFDLRIMMRQNSYIVMGCVIVAMIAYVLPSDPWLWYIPKIIILIPTAFIGFVRIFMLNGVRAELDRRARVSGMLSEEEPGRTGPDEQAR